MTDNVAEKTTKKSEVDSSRKGKDSFRAPGGRKPREQKEFEETILQIARVTRVVKGGRRMRFRVTVIIGDKKGRVGLGIGKAGEVLVSIQKAVAAAKNQLIRVPIFEDTIPHDVNATFKASRILLFPAPEGTGVIAGGAVRKILELSGVKNVLSKIHGSRNPINIAYGTFDALKQLQNQMPPSKKLKKKKEEEKAAEAEASKEAPKQEGKESKVVSKKESIKKEVKNDVKKDVKESEPKKK